MSALHLDPRTKLALILLCVISAMLAPDLAFQFALVALIGLLSVLCGKWRYALRGIIADALICAFTVWCMGVLHGTWRTMFMAFLGLVHKVYACGMLAGLVISTTRVGEFLSAMARLRWPKSLTIPIAVMLRYLSTIREDWHFIKDAMRLRDVSPTFAGFLKAPAMTVNCIYVPLLTAAIVGPSGGGKTTLCHLLARFWDVDGGRVTLGGHDVREYDMDSLMQNFSFVFQNVYLFHDTVANNIRFGQPDAPMEKVTEAAKKARCHDFIMKLPQGYDTVIGEAGGSLSGGERQRLSIARAIMKDAPIIILDEATANVDPENEKELMEAIGELTREKTVIMIAHRLKTVRHADQILVVDKGRIVQRGTHDELTAQDGIYRHFITGREQAVGWKL